jgi:hypothetical protein
MKKIASIIFVFFTIAAFSQIKGTFKICEDIEINHIKFERSRSNEYSKKITEQLISLEFYLINKPNSVEKECYLIKQYDYNINIKDKKKVYEAKELIDITIFYNIIESLNKIDKNNLNENWNVIDGITSTILLSSKNFEIKFSDNFKEVSKSDFYELFNKVWNYYNK